MKKKVVRIITIGLVVLMLVSVVAPMVMPYMG